MEDVLDVYQRPYDPKRPVVCLDETSKELHATPHGSLPLKPGKPRREDYEYARHGVANLGRERVGGWCGGRTPRVVGVASRGAGCGTDGGRPALHHSVGATDGAGG